MDGSIHEIDRISHTTSRPLRRNDADRAEFGRDAMGIDAERELR